MKEQFTTGAENEPKRPFIVINYENEEAPIVLFNGLASSEEEARDIVENVARIKIDYDNETNVVIAFEKPDEEQLEK